MELLQLLLNRVIVTWNRGRNDAKKEERQFDYVVDTLISCLGWEARHWQGVEVPKYVQSNLVLMS